VHRRSQDFLWGCTFLDQKSDDLFSHHLFHGHMRYILPLPTFLSHLRGMHPVKFTPFFLISIKLPTKNFSVALGVHLHPLHPSPWLRLCNCTYALIETHKLMQCSGGRGAAADCLTGALSGLDGWSVRTITDLGGHCKQRHCNKTIP